MCLTYSKRGYFCGVLIFIIFGLDPYHEIFRHVDGCIWIQLRNSLPRTRYSIKKLSKWVKILFHYQATQSHSHMHGVWTCWRNGYRQVTTHLVKCSSWATCFAGEGMFNANWLTASTVWWWIVEQRHQVLYVFFLEKCQSAQYTMF